MKPAWVAVLCAVLLGMLLCGGCTVFFVEAHHGERLAAQLDMCRTQSALAADALQQGVAAATLLQNVDEAQGLHTQWSIYDGQGRLLYGQESPLLAAVPTLGMQERLTRVGGRYLFTTLHQSGELRLILSYDLSAVFAARWAQYARGRWLCLLGGLLWGGGAMVLLNWAARSAQKVERAMRRFMQGHWEERLPPDDPRALLPALHHTYNELADAQEEKVRALEQVARQREEFVASFAHELKTPLTSIIGYADMLRLRVMPPEQVFRAAGFIFSEGKRLESLSLKLMDLIVLRRQVFDRKRISARMLGEDIRAVVTPMLEERQMTLETDLQEEFLYAEPDLLKTMLMNLIDNARKASEAGGRIRFCGRSTAAGYTFSVQDFGRGIPPEELSRITEAFYMVDKSRSRAQNGAGLGLALCQQIAVLHQSRLEFESEVGVGTTVRVTLGAKPAVTRPVKTGFHRSGGRRR